MKLLSTILIIAPFLCFSQGFGDYLSENAIPVNDDFSPSQSIYESFKKHELIMVGEMHGTREPSMLVKTISESILQHEATVSIGIEVPEDQLSDFLKKPNETTLKNSVFFSRENIDGRNGKAWFDLINYCNANPKIKLFFFDNYEAMEVEQRDSAMYLSIVDHRKTHPKSKIITLSGNIHSWLIPFNDSPTMGNYCFNDPVNFTSENICSINHVFSEGTMYNASVEDGLQLKTVEFEESVFSESTNHTNYLIFYETPEPSENNCIFYSRKVTHSEKMDQ